MNIRRRPWCVASLLVLLSGCGASESDKASSPGGAETASAGGSSSAAQPGAGGSTSTAPSTGDASGKGDGMGASAGGSASTGPKGGGVPGASGAAGGSFGSAGKGGGANAGGGAGGTEAGGAGGGAGSSGAAGAAACDHDKAEELYLSADDSNSMAGAEVARGLIDQGQLVFKGLRTYEFLNYYSFDYPPADPGQIRVSAQMHGNADGTYNLQIGVRAPDQAVAERRPFNLTLAVDTSSSMLWGPVGNSALDRAVESCAALANQLRQGDVISVVAWNQGQAVALDSHVASGPSDPSVISTCTSLSSQGATDLSAGLSKAYELAKKNFAQDRINRVVLISDGGANVSTETRLLIENAAQDKQGEAIYLMGAGVGDPWNYNDKIMNLVTDAGRGAYVFLDTKEEAKRMFGPRLLSNLEIAARSVQVKLTLPPTLSISEFHGEQMSTNPEEVEPQHLAMGDAMIFHQVLSSCDPSSLPMTAEIKVDATYEDPVTRQPKTASFSATLGDLLSAESPLLRKGDAVVAYAEALKKVQALAGQAAIAELDKASTAVLQAQSMLGQDPELAELDALLATYKARFDGSPPAPVEPNDKPQTPIVPDCSWCQGAQGLDALRCAADLCDDSTFLGQTYTSPTGSPTDSTWAALDRFGSASNGLAPQLGGSYVVMASGPVSGGTHSVDLGGSAGQDPFSKDNTSIYNAMEWTLKLRAPANANGFSVRYVYFSEEYDDYIGSTYNDKFYVTLRAGSTNSGDPTVINFTECRSPDTYYDFVCGQGLEHCDPGKRYCYVAINAASSECCWYGGCPGGGAKTDIAGTGFSCAPEQGQDGAEKGSSTGWLETQWPIEPNEEFELTFHIHDTGDGIFDSAAIIDRLVFLENAKPGTRQP